MTDEPFGIIPHRVIDARPGAHAIAVYAVLARHADRTRECHPGVRRIAELCGLDVKTVRRAIEVLVGKGFITVMKHPNGQRQEYRLTVGANPTVDSESVGASPTVKSKTVGPGKANRGNWSPKAWEPVPHNEKEREIERVSTPGGRDDLRRWFAVKDELETTLSKTEWDAWVRPAYLLSVLSGGTLQVALPPSGRIIEQARARLPTLRNVAQAHGFAGVVFTRYPDGYDHGRMQREFPEQYERWYGKKRPARQNGRSSNAEAM